MTDGIQELANQLRSEWPTARVEVDSFPSGAAYLDVYCRERHFLLRYFPERGVFGVDEVLADEGFLEKYALISPEADVAAEYLRGLVDKAMCSVDGSAAPVSARPSTA